MTESIGELRAGMLLVATPALLDPNFADTVVLLLDVDDDGALGVVLNRPSMVPVADVLDGWGDVVAEPEVLFHGGPGQHRGRPGRRAAARRRDDVPVGFREVTASSAWSTWTRPSSWSTAAWTGCGSSPGTPAGAPSSSRPRSRRAAGTSCPAQALDVFRIDPAELWRDVLRRQPGELAWHSTRPVDPDLN